jgi:DNA-binding transcriptional LysR family regulator
MNDKVLRWINKDSKMKTVRLKSGTPMDLNALADFALVATHGGLGKASRASGRSKATLSRRIADLEEQLGVRLIERHARGLKLTEAGEQLMARTEAPLHEVADAMSAAREGLSSPRGRLRIAAPVLFAQLAMGRVCADFCAAYPEISCEVVAEDRLVDLVEEQFDVAIRPNPRPDTGLVGRCFAKDRLVVVAAPSHPMPRSAGPVSVPGIVTMTFQASQWTLDGGRLVLEPVPKLRLSSFLTIRDAAVAGAGVALLPQSIAWNELARGELVQWGSVSGGEVSLWVLHTSRRLPAPKVRAFVDFMCERYPDELLVLRG